MVTVDKTEFDAEAQPLTVQEALNQTVKAGKVGRFTIDPTSLDFIGESKYYKVKDTHLMTYLTMMIQGLPTTMTKLITKPRSLIPMSSCMWWWPVSQLWSWWQLSRPAAPFSK